MARKTAMRTQTPAHQHTQNALVRKNPIATFLAGFAGIALGIPLALAVLLPMVHQQLQTDVAALSHKVVAITPASDTLAADNACALPSTSGNSVVTPAHAAVQTTSVPAGGRGGGMPSGNNGNSGGTHFVTKLVSGVWAHNTGTNSNTGAGSTNTVNATNTNTTTVHNTTTITAINDNPQVANSGAVTASQNTGTGTTSSGTAENTSDTSFIFKVDNN